VSRPNAAQLRVLSFLALGPMGQFVELAQFETTRRLRPGDDLFVPSLVDRDWAEMGPGPRCNVRLTNAGRYVLTDPGDDGVGTRFRERKG
jgi:hypothetical protein